MTGGHNGGDFRTEENWYLWRDMEGNFRPGLYNSSQGWVGGATFITRGYPGFSESVDYSKFVLPSICN